MGGYERMGCWHARRRELPRTSNPVRVKARGEPEQEAGTGVEVWSEAPFRQGYCPIDWTVVGIWGIQTQKS